jgi:RNA polymerase primary sigma factor
VRGAAAGCAHQSRPASSLGVYLREISRFRPLTTPEEKEVGRRSRRGEAAAFRTLVESNLRFVVSMARKYARSGYPIQELINEGNLGLIEAARRFDPDRDVRFATYAAWWIRQSILTAIARYGQAVSVPPGFKQRLYRAEACARGLTQELGRAPRLDEIAARLGIPERKLEELLSFTPNEVSLSAPLPNRSGDESGCELADLLGDTRFGPAPAEVAGAQSLDSELEALLAQLEAKERSVVEGRFGLAGSPPQTLRELGEALHLSTERIRQIEVRALGKLRRSRRAQQLRCYLN